MVAWVVVAAGVVARIAVGVEDESRAVAGHEAPETSRRFVEGVAGFVDELDEKDMVVAVAAAATAVEDGIVLDCFAFAAHIARSVWVAALAEIAAADTLRWALASCSVMAVVEAHRSGQAWVAADSVLVHPQQ